MTNIDTDKLVIESGYVPIQDGQLYYEAAGAGHPLLMLHADVADRRMWDAQFAAFARKYRVIRVDKRGFGLTTSASGAYSPSADILALLAHLGISHTSIIGLSNGASQALDFTLEHPKMVDALIVVAGGVSGREPTATPEEMALFATFQELQARQDAGGLRDWALRVWCDGPTQPEGRCATDVRERVRVMLTDTKRLHQETLEAIPLNPPARARLGEIHVPTLVIQGSYDFSSVNAAMDLVAEEVPGAQKAVFATAHMVNMEQPDAFNARVQGFLERALASY